MRSKRLSRSLHGLGWILATCALLVAGMADESESPPRAFVDRTGLGWRSLGEDDFINVNCKPETCTFGKVVIECTGQPVGLTRTRKSLGNFELVAQCRHLTPWGNLEILVRAAESSLEGIKPGTLPCGGIEV
jgi:hypothetical protein